MRSTVGGLCFLAAVLMFPQSALSAYLYVDPSQAELYRGDTETLAVRIDTDEEECINTVDAVIRYSGNIRVVDVSRGDSILSVWVEDPVIDEDAREIRFAGGIPGGYCGRVAGDPQLSNVVAEIVVRSPGFTVGTNDPTATVDFTDATQILLNDGFGTRAPLRYQGAVLTLSGSAGPERSDDWATRVSEDTVPPASFSITLTRDRSAFSGEYYIVFNTQDKQSGIDHYEVMEEPFEEFELFKWGAAGAPWREAKSPYVLRDQSLNSTIRVKAIDKAGNETVATYVPDRALRGVSSERIAVIAGLAVSGILIITVAVYALWWRKRKVESELARYDNDYSDNDT